MEVTYFIIYNNNSIDKKLISDSYDSEGNLIKFTIRAVFLDQMIKKLMVLFKTKNQASIQVDDCGGMILYLALIHFMDEHADTQFKNILPGYLETKVEQTFNSWIILFGNQS